MAGTGLAHGAATAGQAGRSGLRRLLVMLGIANAGLYALYVGVLQVLLPLQVQDVSPARKVAVLGLISGVTAVFATVFNPIGGALSDRTRSRFGRRAPWLAGASLAVLAPLALLGAAGSVWVIIAGWGLAQASANVYQAALTAVVPDRIAPERRGAASAVAGVAMSVGAVAGVGLAGEFAGHLALGYLALGAFLAITGIAFVASTTDPSTAGLPAAPRARPAQRAAGFASALRHRDFACVFAGRAAMILSYFLVASFLLYVLSDYTRLPHGLRPTTAFTILAAISTLASLVAAGAAGPVSDRAGRRKPFVIAAAALSATAMPLPVLSRSFAAMIAFSVLTGLALGTYLAVDLALVTLVLPARQDAARDMGVLNIANAGPQIIAPFLASLVIGHLGGYPALFAAGGLTAIAGALAVVPVRSVR